MRRPPNTQNTDIRRSEKGRFLQGANFQDQIEIEKTAFLGYQLWWSDQDQIDGSKKPRSFGYLQKSGLFDHGEKLKAQFNRGLGFWHRYWFAKIFAKEFSGEKIIG